MSERYTNLFKIPENLYIEGAPVLISAGTLLKDNNTGKILAQIKFQSLTEKIIKALTVKIFPLDTTNHSLGEAITHQYLDLHINRDQKFGSKEPIYMLNNSTRAYTVSVIEVIYMDNTKWIALDDMWASISKPIKLCKVLDYDDSLIKQYQLKMNMSYEYAMSEEKDLWYCGCGAINHGNEAKCHLCKNELFLLDNNTIATLKQERDERLKKEQEEQRAKRKSMEAKYEAERLRIAEYEAHKKKIIAKIKQVSLVVIIVAFVTIVLTFLFLYVFIPNNKYNAAIELMNSNQYEQSIAAFEQLNGYRDSEEQIKNCRYIIANSLYEEAKYDEAYKAFESIEGYKDSNALMKKCKYDKALLFLNNEDYANAYYIFAELGDYKDSMERINQITSDQTIVELIPKLKIKTMNIGDSLRFGNYEQDNDGSNGKEKIEWILLSKENGRALLISKHILDRKPFHSELTDITWEESSLQKWLNEYFISEAFSAEEQTQIENVNLTDERPASNNKIFCLSYNEARYYFRSNLDITAIGTAYADKNISKDYYTSWWWLRTVNNDFHTASGVGGEYKIVPSIAGYTSPEIGVRPAIWVNVE